jgi:hypothetical protein
MNSLTAHISHNSSANAIINCIHRFLDAIDNIAAQSNSIKLEIEFYLDLRKSRKILTKGLSSTIERYDELKTNQRTNLAESLHQAIIRLEHSKKELKSEIKKIHRPIIGDLVCREVNQTLKSFKKNQKKLSEMIIQTKTEMFNRNSELSESLERAWKELALED